MKRFCALVRRFCFLALPAAALHASGAFDGSIQLSLSANYLEFRASFDVAYYDSTGNPDYGTDINGTAKVTQSSPAMTFSESFQRSGSYADVFEGPTAAGACYDADLHATADPPGWLNEEVRDWNGGSVCRPTPAPPPPPQHTACVQSNNECQDPLVLDLNGDGIHTTSINNPVWFDMDGDGVLEQTAWTNAKTGEGFLYLDLDHKGRVTNGSELFGVGTVMPDGSRGRDGFTALAAYDAVAQGGNGDGVLDSLDDVWNRLRIWVDANHDGICDPGETGPIHRYGVQEIELGAGSSNIIDDAGNLHALSSVYHRKNDGGAIDAIGFQRAR